MVEPGSMVVALAIIAVAGGIIASSVDGALKKRLGVKKPKIRSWYANAPANLYRLFRPTPAMRRRGPSRAQRAARRVIRIALYVLAALFILSLARVMFALPS